MDDPIDPSRVHVTGRDMVTGVSPTSPKIELDALARSLGTLTIQRDTFDAGMRVTIKGSIGRLPYLLTISREWGDDPGADEVALRALLNRLEMKGV